MPTTTIRHLARHPGVIRRALTAGDEVAVTYHDKPYARVVAHDQIEAERAELVQLRARVAELEATVAELEAARAAMEDTMKAAA